MHKSWSSEQTPKFVSMDRMTRSDQGSQVNKKAVRESPSSRRRVSVEHTSPRISRQRSFDYSSPQLTRRQRTSVEYSSPQLTRRRYSTDLKNSPQVTRRRSREYGSSSSLGNRSPKQNSKARALSDHLKYSPGIARRKAREQELHTLPPSGKVVNNESEYVSDGHNQYSQRVVRRLSKEIISDTVSPNGNTATSSKHYILKGNNNESPRLGRHFSRELDSKSVTYDEDEGAVGYVAPSSNVTWRRHSTTMPVSTVTSQSLPSSPVLEKPPVHIPNAPPPVPPRPSNVLSSPQMKRMTIRHMMGLMTVNRHCVCDICQNLREKLNVGTSLFSFYSMKFILLQLRFFFCSFFVFV